MSAPTSIMKLDLLILAIN